MKLFLFIFLNLSLVSTAQAASFDCSKASTPIENMICADLVVSKLDGDLAQEYQQALEKSTDKQRIIEEQRTWLKNVRNACLDAECLKNACSSRISDLTTSKTISNAQMEASPKQFLQTWDKRKTKDTKFIAAFPDLNGDGKREAIVYFRSQHWCGTGGCAILILEESGDSWKVVTRVIVAHAPIRVLKMIHNGWHSIGVKVCGGGILKCYEAELRFNGEKYPSIPGNELKEVTEGETIINDQMNTVSLYDNPSANDH